MLDRGENSTYLSVLMIDHNVMRLDVSVHDALAVAVIKSLEQLKDVVPNINVVELGVKAAEVGVVDVLEDQRWGFALSLGQHARRHAMEWSQCIYAMGAPSGSQAAVGLRKASMP